MVHIRDDGVFDAPIDRIWKYWGDNEAHNHRAFQVTKVLKEEGNKRTVEARLLNAKGGYDTERLLMTVNSPKGFDLEYLSGAMKGTKHTHTYTPMGEKTKVVVEGEFTVPPGMTENQVRKQALDYFATAFEEDNSALKKYK
ncbi:MAG TPA: SRPBCC family protein [Thermoplasmata archaeon]|jgi:hypothetical protein